MEIIGTVILSSMISLSDSYDGSKTKAIKTLALYHYKDWKLDQDVKKYSNIIVPDEFKYLTGISVAAYTVVKNKRIEFRWTF